MPIFNNRPWEVISNPRHVYNVYGDQSQDDDDDDKHLRERVVQRRPASTAPAVRDLMVTLPNKEVFIFYMLVKKTRRKGPLRFFTYYYKCASS